ncbi:MAG: hypothetical protein EOO43_16255 [Flavobacterium sp.]|nr:MAG: hypothetical protein EOO43_16255 [Flavobacterium sp.]
MGNGGYRKLKTEDEINREELDKMRECLYNLQKYKPIKFITYNPKHKSYIIRYCLEGNIYKIIGFYTSLSEAQSALEKIIKRMYEDVKEREQELGDELW